MIPANPETSEIFDQKRSNDGELFLHEHETKWVYEFTGSSVPYNLDRPVP